MTTDHEDYEENEQQFLLVGVEKLEVVELEQRQSGSTVVGI